MIDAIHRQTEQKRLIGVSNQRICKSSQRYLFTPWTCKQLCEMETSYLYLVSAKGALYPASLTTLKSSTKEIRQDRNHQCDSATLNLPPGDRCRVHCTLLSFFSLAFFTYVFSHTTIHSVKLSSILYTTISFQSNILLFFKKILTGKNVQLNLSCEFFEIKFDRTIMIHRLFVNWFNNF